MNKKISVYTLALGFGIASCAAEQKMDTSGVASVEEESYEVERSVRPTDSAPSKPRLKSESAAAPSAKVANKEKKPKGASKKDGLQYKFSGAKDLDDAKNTEEYRNHGVNPLTKTADDKFSTFSIDVDTGSYTIARKKLNAGYLPPAASVRVEEFLNYFKYDYPSPEEGAFAVHLEGAPSPFIAKANNYIMRVGVQGKRITSAERKPVHLTFLVDVSGSMKAADKLPLAQKALNILVGNLKADDTVALSTYAGHVAEILPPTGASQKDKIRAAIGQLTAGGGTGMSSGMESAYKSAMKNFKKDHVNRVIILSDGDANIGPKSHQEILSRIKHFADEGITLSTIGVGMGNYKDTTMEQLANKGNGNYYYIDGEREAKKIFGEQLDGTLQVIAKDVKIQVEFDPKKVLEYRLVGYENRDIADEDFRNDRVDAGEIGAGHSVTALYELKLAKGVDGKLATVRIRAKKPDGEKASELAFNLMRSNLRGKLSSASKDFQFQMGVAEFAEVLRKSPYAEGLSLGLVEEVLTPNIAGKADRMELMALLEKAKKLRKE